MFDQTFTSGSETREVRDLAAEWEMENKEGFLFLEGSVMNNTALASLLHSLSL